MGGQMLSVVALEVPEDSIWQLVTCHRQWTASKQWVDEGNPVAAMVGPNAVLSSIIGAGFLASTEVTALQQRWGCSVLKMAKQSAFKLVCSC